MPTVIDETVASSAYDTSGNGGRKIARASTGDLVFVVKNGTTEIRLYKKVGTNAPVLLANFSVTSLTDVCIENVGNGYIGILYSHSGSTVSYRSVSVTLGTLGTVVNVDSGQTAVGNVTMIANNTRTELHMSVSTKNSTYANSWNIRYTKGTINGDGSVTWGAVEQVTSSNTSGWNETNPSIYLRNNVPSIAFDHAEGTSNYRILLATKEYTTKYTSRAVSHASWGEQTIYNGTTYTQSSPSAIFVPQSVNGLPNGRIWVAWQGFDSTDNSQLNIRISYSDDGGVTWSSMQKLTSGNTNTQAYPSITCSKNNVIFVTWQGTVGGNGASDYRIRKISYNGSWSSITNVTSAQSEYPSTLYDLSLDFAEPLFIYKAPTKVGFYGTWTVTTISVTPGSLGIKSDKNNLLSYNITTDGTMSDITEKINGTVVNTRTSPTSGQQFTVSLTQEQWDAIKYGKYKDATGGLNTLTVEMGSDIWTYTFDKRLATDSDVLSAVKAVQDSQQVYLPAVKALLGSAIRAKGGTVNDTDAWSAFVSAVANMQSKKYATGSISIGSAQLGVVSGLLFKPSLVVWKAQNSQTSTVGFGFLDDTGLFISNTKALLVNNSGTLLLQDRTAYGTVITSNGFKIYNFDNNTFIYNWIAFE